MFFATSLKSKNNQRYWLLLTPFAMIGVFASSAQASFKSYDYTNQAIVLKDGQVPQYAPYLPADSNSTIPSRYSKPHIVPVTNPRIISEPQIVESLDPDFSLDSTLPPDGVERSILVSTPTDPPSLNYNIDTDKNLFDPTSDNPTAINSANALGTEAGMGGLVGNAGELSNTGELEELSPEEFSKGPSLDDAISHRANHEHGVHTQMEALSAQFQEMIEKEKDEREITKMREEYDERIRELEAQLEPKIDTDALLDSEPANELLDAMVDFNKANLATLSNPLDLYKRKLFEQQANQLKQAEAQFSDFVTENRIPSEDLDQIQEVFLEKLTERSETLNDTSSIKNNLTQIPKAFIPASIATTKADGLDSQAIHSRAVNTPTTTVSNTIAAPKSSNSWKQSLLNQSVSLNPRDNITNSVEVNSQSNTQLRNQSNADSTSRSNAQVRVSIKNNPKFRKTLPKKKLSRKSGFANSMLSKIQGMNQKNKHLRVSGAYNSQSRSPTADSNTHSQLRNRMRRHPAKRSLASLISSDRANANSLTTTTSSKVMDRIPNESLLVKARSVVAKHPNTFWSLLLVFVGAGTFFMGRSQKKRLNRKIKVVEGELV